MKRLTDADTSDSELKRLRVVGEAAKIMLRECSGQFRSEAEAKAWGALAKAIVDAGLLNRVVA